MTDRKADRHPPGRQHSVSARLDRADFDRLESRRKALSLTRRKAIIQALRDWLDRTETTENSEARES